MILQERYHFFKRGDLICRYGVYGLTREYFPAQQPFPEAEIAQIELLIPEAKFRVLQAVITSQCNLKCSYCSFAANAPQQMSLKMSAAEIEELCAYFNREIGDSGCLLITGGEPELYREAVITLAERIHAAKILFTNGTLTSESSLREYQRLGLGVLFSLDGDVAAQNAARFVKGGSYRGVARALRAARQLGLNYGISAVVGDHNVERLPELVGNLYEEFRPASLGLNLPHRHVGPIWNRIEEYTEALLAIFKFAKREGLFVDQINRRLAPLIERKFRFRDCAAQGEKVVAFPGGRKTTCVNEASLSDGRLNWANRLPILSEQCRDCFAIAICGGGCSFDGEAAYGAARFDERNCYFTRKLLELLVWDIFDELGARASDPIALRERYAPLLHRITGTFISVGHETA